MEEKKVTKKEDSRSFQEKLEDGLDEVVMGVEDAIYGVPNDPNKDIPRMIEHPSGIRRINKVQTRRNLNRIILKKPLLKVVGIIFLIGLAILVITELLVLFI